MPQLLLAGGRGPPPWTVGGREPGLCTIHWSCRRSLSGALRSLGHGGVLEIEVR